MEQKHNFLLEIGNYLQVDWQREIRTSGRDLSEGDKQVSSGVPLGLKT
jgi:hypothetical protein